MSTSESKPSLKLSHEELVLINNALNEVLNGPEAIETSEFQTRIGATVAEAKALLSRVSKAIGSEPPL